MKKFLLLWVVISLIVLLFPKLLDRIVPQVIIKEIPIWRIKEIAQKEIIVEKPVYKERIVEKEKIIYRELRLDLFEINKLDEDYYIINIKDSNNQDCQWEVSTGPNNKGVIFHRKREFPKGCVSANLVGWNY